MKNFGSLDNYIEMHRRRLGLSQEDLSRLICLEHGASVSRYERGTRLPALESLLALEIVLCEPVSALYAGIRERVEAEVAERAHDLLEELGDVPTDDLSLKLEVLGRLARPDEPRIVPIWGDQ